MPAKRLKLDTAGKTETLEDIYRHRETVIKTLMSFCDNNFSKVKYRPSVSPISL